MRILVACEFSGVVRDAFIARGHDAVSCDLEPTDSPGPHHIGDVRDILSDDWDMLIGFPPCTYLTKARAYLWGRDWEKELEAYRFFLDLWYAPIGKIALENPVGMLSGLIRKPDQYIQPHEYGHPYTKTTCLWLNNLPRLTPTNIVEPTEGRYVDMVTGKRRSGKHRSITFPGIARAMAEQWGELA